MPSSITLVLGASPFPSRYAFLAIRSLVRHGHPVLAVGARPGVVDEVEILTDLPQGTTVHTVTVYLNAGNQQEWHDRILALSPARIIFNPGAENAALSRAAAQQGIEVVEGCTLVMLAAGTY